MLKQLCIKNFAVIETLDLSFDGGLTVLTGETGAGKSIMVEALGLALGDRASGNAIRAGCERAEISACFAVTPDSPVVVTLAQQGIECHDELILRRVLQRDGRSRAYINDSPVSVKLARSTGEQLLDIHGQHEHQSLLKREVQRTLLDEFGGHEEQLRMVAKHWQDWRTHTLDLQAVSGDSDDREAHIELLRYQVLELQVLEPATLNLSELDAQHKRLSRVNELLEIGQQTQQHLSGDEHSIHALLARSLNALREAAQYDQALTPLVELLESTAIQLDEADDELRHYLEQLTPEPQQLAALEERLSAVHSVARKHGVSPDALAECLEKLTRELYALEHGALRIEELRALQSKAMAEYRESAEALTGYRLQAAEELGQAVSDQLKLLGMPQGKFFVAITSLIRETPRSDGWDAVEYQIALNPGQPPRPLSQVASGGELSRISLALQVASNRDSGAPTLIFDEVDSGIGGGVAEIVGRLLRRLAARHQVFCVTHLPQVATQGDHHLQVSKTMRVGATSTLVQMLNRCERIEEIARMLGGVSITSQTRAHAEEMLNSV